MEPQKVDDDVKLMLDRAMERATALREQINQELSSMLRVLARMYGVPVAEAIYLKVFQTEDGVFVLDSRTHAMVEGAVVPLPQPEDIDNG